MNNLTKEEGEREKKTRFDVSIHSFFIVIACFYTYLNTMVMMMNYENDNR